MISSAVTTSARRDGTGTPISAPTPAMPESSLSSAPTQETIRVATENQAQYRPKCCAMSSAWPLPVTRPSRTVSSWTM